MGAKRQADTPARIRWREKYQRNIEVNRARGREYYAQHTEERKDYQTRFYKEHPERTHHEKRDADRKAAAEVRERWKEWRRRTSLLARAKEKLARARQRRRRGVERFQARQRLHARKMFMFLKGVDWIWACLTKYKTARGCADCGINDDVVLDFDHLPEHEKLFTIGWGMHRHRPSVVWQEVQKCEVVCSNCHRQRTRARWGPRSNRRELSRAGDRRRRAKAREQRLRA